MRQCDPGALEGDPSHLEPCRDTPVSKARTFLFLFFCLSSSSPHPGSFSSSARMNQHLYSIRVDRKWCHPHWAEQIWCWRIQSSVVGWLLTPHVTVKHVQMGFLPTGSPCFKVTLWVLFLRKCLCCQNNQFIDGRGTYCCCPRLFTLLNVNRIKTMQCSLPSSWSRFRLVGLGAGSCQVLVSRSA